MKQKIKILIQKKENQINKIQKKIQIKKKKKIKNQKKNQKQKTK